MTCHALSHVARLPCELPSDHAGQHRHGRTTWGTDVRRRSGRHVNPRHLLTLDPADYALQRQAADHALEPNWTEWARHVLNIAACDELGLDPLDRTPIAQSSEAPPAEARGAKR